MKMNLKSIAAALFHPVLFFKDKTSMLCTAVHGSRKNRIDCKDAAVKKSDILFRGENNLVNLNGCDVFNTRVFIRGNGHQLIVEEGVKLYNVYIRIIGQGNTVRIGKHSSFAGGNIICGGIGIPIRIGEECTFAEGVDIWATDTHSIYQDGILVNEPKPITIGNHVWLGKDVAVLKGVTIGNDAVIGMRSLITRDVPAASLCAGSPAKIIREQVNWSLNNPNNITSNE